MLRLSWNSRRAATKRGSADNNEDQNESGQQNLVILARVPSKEEVLVRPHAASLKKRTSSKEEFPEDDAPMMKRNNSKEDLRKASISVVPQQDSSKSSIGLKKKSIIVLDLTSLECAIANKDKLAKAMKAAQVAHCGEGLEFLKAVAEWEKLKTVLAKNRKSKEIVARFVREKSPREVCLPIQLKMRMLKANSKDFAVYLAEAKRHVLNDIRFNDRVMQALV